MFHRKMLGDEEWEFKREIRAGYSTLEIINLELIIKPVKVGEVNKRIYKEKTKTKPWNTFAIRECDVDD